MTKIIAPPPKGDVIAYVGCSGARYKIKQRIDMAKKIIKQRYDNKNVYILTFKDEIKTWKEEGFNIPYDDNKKPITITNCAGLDCLRGKNIIVAGKYDYNPVVYTDIWAWCNPDCHKAPTQSKQRVVVKDRSFWLWMFSEPLLKEFQEQILYYYTAQASGRARALREANVEVSIISDYPIRDANKLNYMSI